MYIFHILYLKVGHNSQSVKEGIKNDWWKPFCPHDIENLEYSGKMVLLFAILAECETVKDKILVFSQNLLTLNLIEEYLTMKKWIREENYFRLDGATKIEIRKKYCQQFNDVENQRARL